MSPDGSAIAASSFGMDELCVYEVETLAKRSCADLAPLDAGLRIEDVSWSPDSSRLVLAEQTLVRFVDGDIWTIDAATGDLTNLTDDGLNARLPFADEGSDIARAWVDVNPVWLPDSSGVTFARSAWSDGVWHGTTIETVALAGGESTTLTTVSPDQIGVVYYGMRWSADGSTLYYAVNHPDDNEKSNGIWRINADGSRAEQIAGWVDELGFPALAGVSPDGATLLLHYISATARTGVMSDTGYLYALLDTATGRLTPVKVDGQDPMPLGTVWPATLTPDGAYVLANWRFGSPENQIMLFPVAGGDPIMLTPDGIAEGAVAIALTSLLTWTPDGTVLLNQSDPGAATLLTISGVAAPSVTPPVADIADSATPVASSSSSAYEPGQTVIVNDVDVPLRSLPEVAGQIVARVTIGNELTVVGPPVDADGYAWVPVIDPATNAIGYIRAEFIDPLED